MFENENLNRGIESLEPLAAEKGVGDGKRLSLRAYSLALTGFVLAGFLVMGACASLFASPAFLMAVLDHYLSVAILSTVASIVGIVMMGSGKKRQAVGLSLAGYAVFVLSFGFTTSTILLSYTAATISTAFLATAGIVVVFACLGVALPQVFEKIQGVLMGALLALVVVQVVMLFMGVSQTWIDFVVIVVFCGFIGYDFHKAMYDEPTLVNAVYNASELFLDIINVFVRVLSILGNRD